MIRHHSSIRWKWLVTDNFALLEEADLTMKAKQMHLKIKKSVCSVLNHTAQLFELSHTSVEQ